MTDWGFVLHALISLTIWITWLSQLPSLVAKIFFHNFYLFIYFWGSFHSYFVKIWNSWVLDMKNKKKGNRSMPTCDICYFVKWKRWRNRGKGFLFKTAEKYSILVDLWSWMEIFESNIIITPSLLIIHGNRSNAFWSYFIFSIFMMNGEKIKISMMTEVHVYL